MSILLDVVITTLTPQVVSSLLGGFFGTLLQVNRKVAVYGVVTIVCLGIGGVVAAASASEYVTHKLDVSSIFIHALVGYLVGLLAVSTLDLLSELAPNQMSAIINGTGETALELIKARLRFWLAPKNKKDDKDENSK